MRRTMLLDCRSEQSPRPRLPALLAGLFASAVLFSCGGSSSETPPPLEPHPLNLRYSRASTALVDDVEPVPLADAGAAQPQPQDVDESEDEPARRTWGAEPAARPIDLK